MAKYSKAAGKKVEKVMKEMKKGSLKSGSGKKVTSKKQAIAIGLSEAREKGLKVPAKKAASSKKAATARKATPAKKAATRKISPAKKASPLKKSAATKKVTTTKKSAPAKKAAVSKQATTKKAAPAKKAAPVKKSGSPKKSATPSAPKAIATPARVIKKTATQKSKPGSKQKELFPQTSEVNYPPVDERSATGPSMEEPTDGIPGMQESKGNPIPEDKYSVSRDTYHGHTKPTASKSKIKPSGKKPLWN